MMKIMKKNYIKIMAAAALVLVSACSQETEIGGDSIQYGENTIVFKMGTPNTRSAVALSDVAEQGVTIPLGTDETGTSFYLEESVIDLNAPITRGTPAYTENVGALYGSFAAKSELSTNATGGVNIFDYADEKWSFTFTENIWNKGNPLHFWMYMPTDMTSYGVSNLGYPEEQITFDYQSPTTAAKQQDILFSYRELEKDDYDPKEGASVLFHHALTGVKFAIGNEDKDNITISEVSFTGLYDTGKCTVTPTDENGDYIDITSIHSSTVKTVVAWSDTSATPKTVISSGEFGTPVTFAKPAEGQTTGSFESKGKYPASFSATGNTNNLNDGDATQTFWLIPQKLTNNVKLTIVYYVGDVKNEWTVDFGTALANPYWKAGQIRTYTLRVDAVKVHIEDNITSGQKNGVTITNTGNTKAFIRATIIGNWCSENGEAVFGYTDFIDNPGQYVEIPSWTVDNPDGTFTGLPGNGWVRATDGYFYYTTAVEPGKIIGTAPDGATNADDYVGYPLFISYTPPTEHPDYQIAGKKVDSHFVMEIATQAVNAIKNDGTAQGTTMTWQEAWKEALGTAPATN